MNTDKQLEDAVFYAAATVADTVHRRKFLDQACAGNPGLRRIVEEMLSAQDAVDRFFAKGRLAMQLAPSEIASVPLREAALKNRPGDERLGKWIGPYRLLQRIGEGGCGVVYMAVQEEPVRRKVALKVIKLGMDTRVVIARFDAERQALALMDHPNIARVLDAGATEAGRPYFVMELVRGVKITEYCDKNNLNTVQRLELFIQICHAIQHAHQKAVIHRDIKPSNILVTLHDGVPVPKVIDFGIAKAIEGKLTEQTLFTGYQQLLGTPAYMSPEQAEMSGLGVDTRSDVYSLGVLLYELLTGRTPFDGKDLVKSGLEEMRRTLREKDPQRPSTILTTLHGTELRTTAEHRHEEAFKLVSLLKGDLDWIVMKALDKDRTRRYETANGLAMDVRRYLSNEPVVARPPSRLYRLQKLVRRNKAAFTAGFAVVLTLMAGLGTSTYLFFMERNARHEQAILREKAEQAEKRETKLRQRAEAREKINLAAIYVVQEKFEEASKLLDQVTIPLPRPSFDGINAFRRLGQWLALHERWPDAADRFYSLMDIDRLDDWRVVTLDYQACSVVLVESGDLKRYDKFCQTAIETFASVTNGDACGRILKSCLLVPTGKIRLKGLQPMASVAQAMFQPMPANNFPGWAAIPLGLWRYRLGDYGMAQEWCLRGLAHSTKDSSLEATLQIILSMSSSRIGKTSDAGAGLNRARTVIDDKFLAPFDMGDNSQGFWYDWVFARILLHEAGPLQNPR